MEKIDTDPKTISRLDLIVCDHCKNNFEDQEELYAINAVKFDLHHVMFRSLSRLVTEDYATPISVRRTIRLHKDCLCELVGSGWLI